MQVIAPWVHAHTGNETGGFLHVPGLEFFSKTGKAAIQAYVPPLDRDIIIGVQAGFWGEADKAKLSPTADDQPCLLSAALSVRRPQFAARFASIETPSLPPSCAYRNAVPRAPPSRV
jgi:hypothetical protein